MYNHADATTALLAVGGRAAAAFEARGGSVAARTSLVEGFPLAPHMLTMGFARGARVTLSGFDLWRYQQLANPMQSRSPSRTLTWPLEVLCVF